MYVKEHEKKQSATAGNVVVGRLLRVAEGGAGDGDLLLADHLRKSLWRDRHLGCWRRHRRQHGDGKSFVGDFFLDNRLKFCPQVQI